MLIKTDILRNEFERMEQRIPMEALNMKRLANQQQKN